MATVCKTITLTVAADTHPASYELKPKYNQYKPHTQIGRLNMFRDKTEKPDLLDLMGILSKGARDFFLELKDHLDYLTGTSLISTAGLSKGQLNKRGVYYKELAKHDLVRKLPVKGIKDPTGIELRFPCGTYVISPEFILPSMDRREFVNCLWRQVL